jgi:hypothetical protein
MKESGSRILAMLVLVLGVITAMRCTIPAADLGPGKRAFLAVDRFLKTRLQCPQPVKVQGPVTPNCGWTDKGNDRWEVWGMVEITNHPCPWKATLRDLGSGRAWFIDTLSIDGHTVNRNGRIWPVPAGPNPERGHNAFKTSVSWIQRHLERHGLLIFSAPDSADSGWTNVGANLWSVHGSVERDNEVVPWTATLKDAGENWQFEFLKVGHQSVIDAGRTVSAAP